MYYETAVPGWEETLREAYAKQQEAQAAWACGKSEDLSVERNEAWRALCACRDELYTRGQALAEQAIRDLSALRLDIDKEYDRPDPIISALGEVYWRLEKGEGIRDLTGPEEELTKRYGLLTEEDLDVIARSEAWDYLDDPHTMSLTDEGYAEVKEHMRRQRVAELALIEYFEDKKGRKQLDRKRATLRSLSPSLSEDDLESTEAATVRGERFERHVAEVLGAEWPDFECQHLGTHKRTERGIDLLFVSPEGERIGVQCKLHADTNAPSYREWQSFLGGCTFHQIPEGHRAFVTTGKLTTAQRVEAKKLGVVVFYKDELARIAEEHGIEPWSFVVDPVIEN